MIRTFTVPLVGMRFRPPAEDVCNSLPGGAVLRIETQPENPYDTDAVAVYIDGLSKEGKAAAAYEILARFFESEGEQAKLELLTDPMMLGFVANSEKTGGKCASTVKSYLDLDGRTGAAGKLTFDARGMPTVTIEWDSDEKPPEEQAAVTTSPLERIEEMARQPLSNPGDERLHSSFKVAGTETGRLPLLKKALDDDIPF